MQKTFVLDTSVLLRDPYAPLTGFDDNIVVVPGPVLQDLERMTQGPGSEEATDALRVLGEIQKTANLSECIDTIGGGKMYFCSEGVEYNNLPRAFSLKSIDNQIISICVHLKKSAKRKDAEVILVTNKVSLRVNAGVCGIKAEEYRNSVIEDSGYTGYQTVECDPGFIDAIYASEGRAIPCPEHMHFTENEFVTFKCGSQSAMTVYRKGQLVCIQDKELCGWIQARNNLQKYAMWALTQPASEIPLVILLGPAGTAKTFLSLAAGMDGTYTTQKRISRESQYNKITLSRPVAESYQELGFLPGGLDDKLAPLLASYYDNMEILLGGKDNKEEREQILMQMQDILDSGVVELCGLTFIRGRSFVNTYFICDEAQNATPTRIRDVISRAGEGTKIVICGDPGQIDVPTLDKNNNGLIYAVEHMKGSPYCAIVKFTEHESVRSKLAREVVKRMS